MITGVDTNILCYALDPAYPEHEKLKNLLIRLSPENRVAINPTYYTKPTTPLSSAKNGFPTKPEED